MNRVIIPHFEIVANPIIFISPISCKPYVTIYQNGDFIVRLAQKRNSSNLHCFMFKTDSHCMIINTETNSVFIFEIGIRRQKIFSGKIKRSIDDFLIFKIDKGIISDVVVYEFSINNYIEKLLKLSSFS